MERIVKVIIGFQRDFVFNILSSFASFAFPLFLLTLERNWREIKSAAIWEEGEEVSDGKGITK
jgi:hypothetical protein